MRPFSILRRRLRALFAREDVERDMEEELRLHLELQAREHERRGLGTDAARRAAVQSFGGLDHVRESYRDARGVTAIEHLVRDARFAFRRLRHAPSFSLGVIATLGVGVGAAVAIGALVYGVLLRPLPYAAPDALVEVTLRTPGFDGGGEFAHSTATFAHFRDAARSFESFGGYMVNDAVNLTDRDDPQRVTAVMITPGALAALRAMPVLGKPLTDADAEVGFAGTVPVLISHELWRQRYASDSAIVGGLIEVNRRQRRVVGVLPPGFAFPTPAARVYFPLEIAVTRARLENRHINVVARLRDGVSVAQAETELQTVIARIPDRFPNITPDDLRRSRAAPGVVLLRDAIVAPVREHLRVLALTMLFVLLIATANVANLFLLRSDRLRHEIAVSAALGGGSAALLRRFVTEGAMLGLAGTAIALPIVAGALTWRFGFSSRELPRLNEIAFGLGPVVATLAVSMILGGGVGVLAFTRSRRVGLQGLRASSRTSTSSGAWRRVQQGLVATQVAVGLALVASAALLGRSLWNLNRVELGFAPEGRFSFEATLPYSGYENYTKVALFHAAVLDRLRAIPGVLSADAALETPLIQENPGDLTLDYDAVGGPPNRRGGANMASPDYFRTMGIPLLHGRSFMPGDVRAENPAIVLSASLARELFGREDALGERVRPPGPGADIFFRVVGIVGDVPRWRIEDGAAPMAYFPLLRDGDGVRPDSVRIPFLMGTPRYVVRSDLPLERLAPVMREAVRGVDRRVPVSSFTSMRGMVDAATARVRLTMLLLAASAAAALVLGVIGIYSVVAYAVAGRRRELGVRIALGATPSRIRRMILGEGGAVIGVGVVIGLAAAFYGARFAESLLYGVSARDPMLFAAATALLVLVAVAATLVPAHRAARLDPVEVMRSEG